MKISRGGLPSRLHFLPPSSRRCIPSLHRLGGTSEACILDQIAQAGVGQHVVSPQDDVFRRWPAGGRHFLGPVGLIEISNLSEQCLPMVPYSTKARIQRRSNYTHTPPKNALHTLRIPNPCSHP